ncbi:DUF3422 domain-containing protein [Plasticicumulans sp.]|uniref:DUF3422 family protein n=1 Tax=Plasticicumulans sp. TaxID=2307179 RepID=UPI002C480BDE|nr:DUF3422 domain-containing protein [Plasticicumulans sp.]HND97873.1 DUF3422 domain-containing protein [Plasticicumulans sp.]HNF65540.1 DUF3422 domain-containing protein [Plasticicumulans sp.]HNG49905.1 DUF3422 domain-containing protein [Plasticicumulans sp.]
MSSVPGAAPPPAFLFGGLREHATRRVLDHEIHARPSEELRAPARASHLAVLSGPDGAAADRAHVAELCWRYGVEPPASNEVFHAIDLGPLRLRWERHTEFSSYTFLRAEPDQDDPFAAPPIASVPSDWLAGLPGEVLVATHVILESGGSAGRDLANMQAVFGTTNIAGSRVLGGAAVAWSDFRIHPDGFDRLLVADHGLSPRQAGRLVQRLLEIETYRMLAMLGFPNARRSSQELNGVERRLAEITGRMTGNEAPDAEAKLLTELSDLAAEVERGAATSTYRFAASRAYRTLVERRIEELREERIEGLQTLEEFMERRLAPAMRTVEAVRERQSQLSERVARATGLLRTRVDVTLQQQNQALLASMNRRADLQLRLQETVEGLSVVVLSYYLVSLLGYLVKALSKAGLPLNPEIVSGAAVPVALAALTWKIGRMRKALAH